MLQVLSLARKCPLAMKPIIIVGSSIFEEVDIYIVYFHRLY